MNKVRELAKLLVGGLNPNGYDSSWAEAVDVFERILRAELQPLLDAAEDIVPSEIGLECGSFIDGPTLRRLAAELEKWRKP